MAPAAACPVSPSSHMYLLTRQVQALAPDEHLSQSTKVQMKQHTHFKYVMNKCA